MTLVLLIVVGAGNQYIESFRQAKQIAPALHTETFYCGCPLVSTTEGLGFDPGACGYQARRPNLRSRRVEWEHVVPAARIGQMFQEYRVGHPRCVTREGKAYRGRRCAERTNQRYRRALADLYNLRPAIGELNQDRSAHPMGEIPGEPRDYGACDFEVVKGVVEPPRHRRGEVARTYLYMDQTYGPFLRLWEYDVYREWSAADPVTPEECTLAYAIHLYQRNPNPVVTQACQTYPK